MRSRGIFGVIAALVAAIFLVVPTTPASAGFVDIDLGTHSFASGESFTVAGSLGFDFMGGTTNMEVYVTCLELSGFTAAADDLGLLFTANGVQHHIVKPGGIWYPDADVQWGNWAFAGPGLDLGVEYLDAWNPITTIPPGTGLVDVSWTIYNSNPLVGFSESTWHVWVRFTNEPIPAPGVIAPLLGIAGITGHRRRRT